MAATKGQPATAAFCTSSKLALPLKSSPTIGERQAIVSEVAADELVERVVPSHVFGDAVDAAVGRERCRSMDAAGLLERPPGAPGALPAASPESPHRRRTGPARRGRGCARGRPRSKPCRRCHSSRSRRCCACRASGSNAADDARLTADHVLGRVQRGHVAGGLDDALGVQEPESESGIVTRSAHGHGHVGLDTGIGRAVDEPDLQGLLHRDHVAGTRGDAVRDDIDLYARDAVRGSRVRTGELHASCRRVPALPAPPPEPRTPPASSSDGWPAGPRLRSPCTQGSWWPSPRARW